MASRNPEPRFFQTVPRQDHLGLWSEGVLNVRRLTDFLRLTKADVARISGVAVSSVRFDKKMPEDMTQRLADVATLCGLVAQYFDGDVTRTALWWRTPNPLLGDISPRDMIRHGRQELLRRFIMDALLIEAGERCRDVLPVAITDQRETISALCRRYSVRRLAVFGSAVRTDFDPGSSDIDLAVEFGAPEGLSPAHQYFDFKHELERLLARPVDLVELSAMPETRLKRLIERTQVPLYAEAA